MLKQRVRQARIIRRCNARTDSFAWIYADRPLGKMVIDKKLLQHSAGVVAHEPFTRGHVSKGMPSDLLVYCLSKINLLY